MTVKAVGLGALPHAPVGKQPIAVDGFAAALEKVETPAPQPGQPALPDLDGAHFFDHLERAACGPSGDGLFIHGFTVEHAGTFGIAPASTLVRRQAVEKQPVDDVMPLKPDDPQAPVLTGPGQKAVLQEQAAPLLPKPGDRTLPLPAAAPQAATPEERPSSKASEKTPSKAPAAANPAVANPPPSPIIFSAQPVVAVALGKEPASKPPAPDQSGARFVQRQSGTTTGAALTRAVDVAPADAAARPAAPAVRAAQQPVAVAVPKPAGISRIKQPVPGQPPAKQSPAGQGVASAVPVQSAAAKEAAPGQKQAPAKDTAARPATAAAEPHAAVQKLEAKEKLAEAAKPASAAAPLVAARDAALHVAAPASHASPAAAQTTPAQPAPAPAAAHPDALAYDPSLRMTMKPGEARISLDAAGGVSLHVQVQNGVANVRAEGAAAPLLSQNLPELRASLASNGLSLGSFERGDSKERQQPEEADAPTPAGKPIANAPAQRGSKSRLDVEA
jgi:hypothetical protein